MHRKSRLLALATFPVLLAASSARAADNDWLTAGGGSWSDPVNWSLGTVPAATDDVHNFLVGAPITFSTSAAVNSFLSNSDLSLLSGVLAGSQAGSATPVQVNAALLLNGAGLSNLTLNQGAAGTVTFAANGNNYLDAVNLAANVTVPEGGYAQLFNANTLSATVTLASTTNGLQLRDGSASLTISSTGVVQGYGTLYEVFGGSTTSVAGKISADTASQTLSVNTSNLTGAGVLDARNGGVLSIGGRFNPTGMSISVDANPASAVRINGGGLAGSLGTTTGTGLSFSANGNNYLDTATTALGSRLTVSADAYAQVFNINTINGEIAMSGTANGLQLRDGNALLHLSSTGNLHGFGTVYAVFGGTNLQNDGQITADTASKTLTINTGLLTGSGNFAATNGGTLAVGARWTGNAASVTATAGTVLIDGGGITGTFSSSTGTGISFSSNGNNYIDNATVAGNLSFPEGAYSRAYNASSISGLVTLASDSNGLQLYDGNATVSIAAAGTVQGYGAIYAVFGGTTFNVDGLASANTSGKTLAINTANLTGSGTLDARNGGNLSIGAFLNGTGIHVDVDGSPNSIVQINGGTLAGSLGVTSGTGLSFSANGNNAINTATTAVGSRLSFNEGSYSRVYNANTIGGEIAMASNSNGIQLNDGNALLHLTATGDLRGFGTVFEVFSGSTVQNDGLISADVPGQTLRIAPSNTTGIGNFEARQGGTLALGGTLRLTNATITASTGTVLLDGGNLGGTIASTTGTGVSLSGNSNNALQSLVLNGRLTVPEGGYARVYDHVTLNGETLAASVSNGIQLHDGNAKLTVGTNGNFHGVGNVYSVFGGTQFENLGIVSADSPGNLASSLNFFVASFNNAGSLIVTPFATVTSNAAFTQTAGSTRIDGNLNLNSTYTVSGGSVSGNGYLLGTLNMTAGAVDPGDSPGKLHILGNYLQGTLATLDIELAGLDQGISYDLLAVTGTADVAGTLNVSLLAGYSPSIGDTYTIVIRNGGLGTFDNLTSSTGLTYDVGYFTDHIQITLTAIPEPASAIVGFAPLAVLARRRRTPTK